MIDVGIIGPNGIGPLSRKPIDIATPFDPTVPPKDVQIELLEHSLKPMIVISWKASCHSIQQSYKVSKFLLKVNFVDIMLNKFNNNK